MHDLECTLNFMQVFFIIKHLIKYNASEKQNPGIYQSDIFVVVPFRICLKYLWSFASDTNCSQWSQWPHGCTFLCVDSWLVRAHNFLLRFCLKEIIIATLTAHIVNACQNLKAGSVLLYAWYEVMRIWGTPSKIEPHHVHQWNDIDFKARKPKGLWDYRYIKMVSQFWLIPVASLLGRETWDYPLVLQFQIEKEIYF